MNQDFDNTVDNEEEKDYRPGIDQDGGLAFLCICVGVFFGMTSWFGFAVIGVLAAAYLTIAER